MIPFELQLPEGVTLNTETNTLAGTVGTSSYSMGVSTAPVEATVSAKIDGTPTTVTENAFSVPTTAQSIVITVEAEGYETGTYTFTNTVVATLPFTVSSAVPTVVIGENTITGTTPSSSVHLTLSSTVSDVSFRYKKGTGDWTSYSSYIDINADTTVTLQIEASKTGYATTTKTFTCNIAQVIVSSDGNWLMLTEGQLQENYAINYNVLNDGSTFVPYNYEDPITIAGTVGSNTTIELANMWHWAGTEVGKRYALTVGIKRHTAEGYIYYPVCTLNDGSTLATTGQKTPNDATGVPPTTITVGDDVYDIYCFVFADSAYRFGKVELMKKSTEPDSVATVEATLTVNNTDATYDDGGALSFTLSSSTTGVTVRNSGTRKITVGSAWQMNDIVMNIVCGIQGATFTAIAVDINEQEVPLTVTGSSFTIPANNLSDYSSITVKGNAGSYTETGISYMLVVN